MKKIAFYSCIITVLCSILVCGINGGWAEELTFPTTEEEIINTLTPPSQPSRGKGALPTTGDGSALFDSSEDGGLTRGLARIVEDEKALAEAPKTGALVLFDYNSAAIKPDSIPLLQEYGKALQGALQDAVLVVAGHTDHIGSDAFNLNLSERRAKSVKTFLVSEFQIEKERLIIKPYGESKPIEDNTTPEGRAKNRRVEFIRIK